MGVKELRHVGLFPDILLARSTQPLLKEARDKLALFAGLPVEKVLSNHDISHLLEAVIVMEE